MFMVSFVLRRRGFNSKSNGREYIASAKMEYGKKKNSVNKYLRLICDILCNAIRLYTVFKTNVKMIRGVMKVYGHSPTDILYAYSIVPYVVNHEKRYFRTLNENNGLYGAR